MRAPLRMAKRRARCHRAVGARSSVASPYAQWKVIVHDRYPAYITWETFERIQAMCR